MALNTTFGDGTPITFREMNEIRSAIHRNMVFSRWKKGDILCIDNFSTSHGRQPTYDKGRKVIVAWSHPQDKTQPILPQPGVPVSNVVPYVSPENTLTSTQSTKLSESLLKVDFADSNHVDAILKHRQQYSRDKRRQLASCPNLFQPDSDFWKSVVCSE